MMNIQKVSDVYDGNAKAHAKFEEVVGSLNDSQTGQVFDGEQWTIAQIVEHVALVDDGMSRICAKLLGQAETAGQTSDGTVEITPGFFTRSDEIAVMKVEAPERVHPIGGKTIAESLEMMNATRERFENLRPAFEKYDCREHKFPHPFFGDISAAEWLVLSGGHKARHLRQIQKLLAKM